MNGSNQIRFVLVGTYRYVDGTVIEAVDEYLCEDDARFAYQRLEADQQWAPHTKHTAEIMSREVYNARLGLVPADQQDTSRFIGALFAADRTGLGYGGPQ